MSKSIKNLTVGENGDLSYKRDVVVQIIELAAKEISGVVSFGSTLKLNIKSAFSKKYSKGVFINATENGLEIEVYLNIMFGHSVNDVAFRVQENIKRSIESMTEYKVKRVNVCVVGVAFSQEQSVYM